MYQMSIFESVEDVREIRAQSTLPAINAETLGPMLVQYFNHWKVKHEALLQESDHRTMRMTLAYIHKRFSYDEAMAIPAETINQAMEFFRNVYVTTHRVLTDSEVEQLFT